VIVTVNTYSTRDAWAADRHDPTTIGASEAPAVLGVSPFMSAWEYYEHKTQRPKRESGAQQLTRGHRWESSVLADYEDASGNRVVLPGERFGKPGHLVTLANPAFEWLRESPDAFAVDAHGVEFHLEAKTAMRAHDWSPQPGIIIESWRDEHAALIPPHVAIQAYVQLAVTELPWNDVCALVPRAWDFPLIRWVRVMRDVETQGEIVEALAAWRHDHLVKRLPPANDGDPACNRFLARKFTAPDPRPSRVASASERDLVHALVSARATIEVCEGVLKQTTNSLGETAADGARLLITDDEKGPYAQVEKMPGRASIDLDLMREENPAVVSAYEALIPKYSRPGEPSLRAMVYRLKKKEGKR
jgi:predicted phage-related endonuclease